MNFKKMRGMTFRLRDLSLGGKILAISAVSSFVTLSLFCALTFHRDWHNFKERKINTLGALAEILATNTAAALRFDDPHIAREYVASLEPDRDIKSVILYARGGEVFASFTQSPGAEARPYPTRRGAFWQDDRLYYAHEIASHGRSLGKVLIEMDAAAYRAFLWRGIYSSVLLLLGGLALSMLLAWRLRRLITDPVDELVRVTRDLSEQTDYQQRARKFCDDEIGALVDSFNRMLAALGARDAQLRNVNNRLERVVGERTRDLRARNEELKAAMEAASAASVAKSEFLATTSHELRTPLNPIIGYVEKMQREQPDGPYRRELGLIRHSAEQLLRLIDDILDFSRIERGVLRLRPEPLDLQCLCRDVLKLMEAQAKRKEVHLRLSFQGPVEGRRLVADEGRLRQILLNLLSNAIKFTHEGEVCLSSKVEELGEERWLRLSVADTGIGIDPADRNRLFQPFSQIDGTWSREFGGIGLGLAICQKIARAMGGEISLESERGKGSVFTVTIPVQLTAAEPAAAPKIGDRSEEAIKPAPASRILLVEDELVNRELMHSLLAGLGHEVFIACNGLEAVEKARSVPFDFVLMDISMPKMNGFEAAQALRALGNGNSAAPIVAMTAHVTPEDKERCYAAGMDDYLSKPISFSKLKVLLERWLAKNVVR